jgi:hypothetical protein
VLTKTRERLVIKGLRAFAAEHDGVVHREHLGVLCCRHHVPLGEVKELCAKLQIGITTPLGRDEDIFLPSHKAAEVRVLRSVKKRTEGPEPSSAFLQNEVLKARAFQAHNSARPTREAP